MYSDPLSTGELIAVFINFIFWALLLIACIGAFKIKEGIALAIAVFVLSVIFIMGVTAVFYFSDDSEERISISQMYPQR